MPLVYYAPARTPSRGLTVADAKSAPTCLARITGSSIARVLYDDDLAALQPISPKHTAVFRLRRSSCQLCHMVSVAPTRTPGWRSNRLAIVVFVYADKRLPTAPRISWLSGARHEHPTFPRC